MKNGKYEGKGKLYDEGLFDQGRIKYEGDFKNGKYDGKGKEYDSLGINI